MGFADQDPYVFSSNSLSPRGLRDAYLNGATSVASTITFSALVAEQPALDTSALDAGLAVQIDAYQQQLLAQANYFSTVTGDFIQLAADANNFSALMKACAGETTQLLVGAEADEAKRAQVASVLETMADEAGNLLLRLATIDTHLKALEGNLLRNNASYDTAVASAITQLGAKAAAAQAEIDRLTTSVAERISDIVKGANQEGEAVADLFIGILTQFTKSGAVPNTPKADPTKPDPTKPDPTKPEPAKPAPATPATPDPKLAGPAGGAAAAVAVPKVETPKAPPPKTEGPKSAGDGTKPPADKPADKPGDKTPAKPAEKPKDEMPNAEFVIKAVKASFNGISTYSSAIRNLELDNAALAEAYMALAVLSPQVAVAKSAQSQKNLFSTSVAQTRTAMAALHTEWTAVRTHFVQAAKDAERIDTAIEAKALGKIAASAATMWAGVSDEIDALRRALTGSGGLPGS